MLRAWLVAACAITICATSATTASAEGWGTLTGQFVYDGVLPKAPALAITKDGEVCGKCSLTDEEGVVVDPETKGVANVVLYLRSEPSAIAPSYKTMKAEVRIDNKCCRFEPHIVALTLDQTLIVGNPDPIGHNASCAPPRDEPFNPLLTPGQDFKHKFQVSQRLPQPISCSIHPWMKGYVLPRDNPYFAVTGKDGKFEIKDLPAGEELEIQVWQEKAGYLIAKPEWIKGRYKGVITLKVEAGKATDLGVVKLDPALFTKGG